jgi:hypothetical protein
MGANEAMARKRKANQVGIVNFTPHCSDALGKYGASDSVAITTRRPGQSADSALGAAPVPSRGATHTGRRRSVSNGRVIGQASRHLFDVHGR